MSTSAKPGDVVVVYDEDAHRRFWKYAVIEKLIVGNDGLARGAVLRLSDKDGRRTTPVMIITVGHRLKSEQESL